MLSKIKKIWHSVQETNKRMQQMDISQKELLRLTRENYWANIFHTATRGRGWIAETPFNVGRMAAGYALLYVLYRILNETKPQNVLELGMGETSKMIQLYKQKVRPDALCVTVEHDKEWIAIKKKEGLSEELISVITPELENTAINGKSTLQYKDLSPLLEQFDQKFNLILIDGPFGSADYSRHNIIELVDHDLLADEFIIILDDSERKGEQDTLKELNEILRRKNIQFSIGIYAGDKSTTLITSDNLWFLTSM